jgi:adenine-specific DNA-methyltransferase
MVLMSMFWPPKTEPELAAVAMALGARGVRGWSDAEEKLCASLPKAQPALVREASDRITAGEDPLGDAFCALRTSVERRPAGATYTPTAIVAAMNSWSVAQGPTARVVDPGAGSGRFIIAAGRVHPSAALLAVEIDPLAAMLARANLAATGLGDRGEVRVEDYRTLKLPQINGKTLFIGNPPYVRHHLLDSSWKSWMTATARSHGLSSSQLAGLHVHFFLATLTHARPGDIGAYVTASEWLDVNYGQLVRDLLLGGLGGQSIHLVEPKAMPFPDAITTAAITCFHVAAKAPSIYMRGVETVAELADLRGGVPISRERLAATPRWSTFIKQSQEKREDFVALGELCRVHRGQVTGANDVWIAGEHAKGLPSSVLFPSVTKARELFGAGAELSDSAILRRVIDLPADLDEFDQDDRKAVDKFLRFAREKGAHDSSTAKRRKAWWSVGLREPAPILATYMARRPPAFVRNRAAARHINIAHGLYPRDPMSEKVLRRLAAFLATDTKLAQGRVYAGGLTKFEPKEMERLLVPRPDVLSGEDWPDAVAEGICGCTTPAARTRRRACAWA